MMECVKNNVKSINCFKFTEKEMDESKTVILVEVFEDKKCQIIQFVKSNDGKMKFFKKSARNPFVAGIPSTLEGLLGKESLDIYIILPKIDSPYSRVRTENYSKLSNFYFGKLMDSSFHKNHSVALLPPSVNKMGIKRITENLHDTFIINYTNAKFTIPLLNLEQFRKARRFTELVEKHKEKSVESFIKTFGDTKHFTISCEGKITKLYELKIAKLLREKILEDQNITKIHFHGQLSIRTLCFFVRHLESFKTSLIKNIEECSSEEIDSLLTFVKICDSEESSSEQLSLADRIFHVIKKHDKEYFIKNPKICENYELICKVFVILTKNLSSIVLSVIESNQTILKSVEDLNLLFENNYLKYLCSWFESFSKWLEGHELSAEYKAYEKNFLDLKETYLDNFDQHSTFYISPTLIDFFSGEMKEYSTE